MCVLHNDARPHTANAKQLGWDTINHPAHSPDMTPSDFHVFTSLKLFVVGKRFSTNDNIQSVFKEWAKLPPPGDNFNEGNRKLIPRLTKWATEGVTHYII